LIFTLILSSRTAAANFAAGALLWRCDRKGRAAFANDGSVPASFAWNACDRGYPSPVSPALIDPIDISSEYWFMSKDEKIYGKNN
jgi:hypothetical protein